MKTNVLQQLKPDSWFISFYTVVMLGIRFSFKTNERTLFQQAYHWAVSRILVTLLVTVIIIEVHF